MRDPRVAVLILTCNGLELLKNCLKSVVNPAYPNLQVYVIDNGSTDDSCKFVRSNYPNVKLVCFKRNLGFADAYNRALRTIEADYIVLLNNDTVVDSNFVDELVQTAEANSNVGSVGCKILQLDTSRRYGPVFFTGNGLFIGPLFFGSTIGKSAVFSTYAGATECVANCGAAVLYRKSLVDEIGLFDSDFWMDWEDHDLGFRICVAGYRNLYTERTKVMHVGAAYLGSVDSRRRSVREKRNMLFTYAKNYEARNIALRLFPLLFVILPFRELAVVLENEVDLLLHRDIVRRKKIRATYLASAAAYLQFMLGLRQVMKKRQVVQSHRRVSDRDIIRRTSKHLI